MATQDILTFLINAIAFSFTALLITEFIVGLMPISTTSSNQLLPADISKIFEVESESEESSILSDPWFLPIDNEVQKIVSPVVSVLQLQIPLLLLPPAKDLSSPSGTDTEPILDKLLYQFNVKTNLTKWSR